jgi:hypothetical protein
VAIRTRLKGLTVGDEEVLRLVGAHLGSLASRDLKQRCAEGLEHSTDTWAQRKRALSGESSSRWAGSITKATHEQWALSRRAQLAHIQGLEAGVRMIAHRLSLPVGEKGTKRAPGGYRSRQEWFAKTRRLHVLEDRLAAERADREAGRVRVARGGKQLARNRHHLDQAQLTEAAWRQRWEASRWFLQADGESGKRFGNETIRLTPDGEVSIKLPAPAGSGSATRRSASRRTVRSASSSPHRSRIWRTPGTAGTSSPAPSPSTTEARSGPTVWRRTGPWPTASTSTPTGTAGTSPPRGPSRRLSPFHWPRPAPTG